VEANSWGPGFYLPTAVAMARNVVLLVATTLWLLEQLRLNRATRSAPVGEIRSPTPPKAVATVAPSGHVAS
jgi:hypothetical protein